MANTNDQDTVNREIAATHLLAALQMFKCAFEEMLDSAKSFPVLEDYVENVHKNMEQDDYGIGGIRNVIDLLEDHDQEIPDDEAIQNVL